MTEETTEITHTCYRTIPNDMIKTTIEISDDLLLAPRDKVHGIEAQVDSKTTHAMILTAHAQATFAFEKEIHFEVMNIHV